MLNHIKATRVVLLTFSVVCFQNFSHAQLNAATIGCASDLGANCFIITPDTQLQSGGVWYDNPIDFATDFKIYYQNNFGTKDVNGADGMALVFKTDSFPLIGGTGGGIGYQGILNSLIIEFDTYMNLGYGDKSADHIAIMSNGIASHLANSSLTGQVQASLSSVNIEDGKEHEVKIVWTAKTKTLEVYFDCDLRLSLTKDLKTDIFGGDDSIFFGFVGSTGGLSNIHKVCFNSISFVENLNLTDATICAGDTVLIDATIPSGVTYTWSPATGVSDPMTPNPILSPTSTTNYTVSITDVCGDATFEDVLITVTPNIIPYFIQIDPVCVESDSPFVNTSINGIAGSWSPAFDASTTTYTFTADSGQCANTTTMNILFNPTITPTFTAVKEVCVGSVLSPLATTSNEGITGSWTPSLNNLETTLYTFIPDSKQCAGSTTMMINVKAISALTITAKKLASDFDSNQIISVSAAGGSGSYEYQLDGGVWQSSSTFEYLTGCRAYNVAVRDALGCSAIAETSVKIMQYPKFFTPNGDGYNDTWSIKCLKGDTSAMISIFDRYGKLLSQFKPSQTTWNGLLNGAMLSGSDYWFSVNYLNNNNTEAQFKSHFSLRH